MPLAAGDYVLLVYGAEPDLYHMRLLVGFVTLSLWIVVTPTFDVFLADISGANPDLIDLRACDGNGGPAAPRGQRHQPLFQRKPRLIGDITRQLAAFGARGLGICQNGADLLRAVGNEDFAWICIKQRISRGALSGARIIEQNEWRFPENLLWHLTHETSISRSAPQVEWCNCA